jgi:hypothetical protein
MPLCSLERVVPVLRSWETELFWRRFGAAHLNDWARTLRFESLAARPVPGADPRTRDQLGYYRSRISATARSRILKTSNTPAASSAGFMLRM